MSIKLSKSLSGLLLLAVILTCLVLLPGSSDAEMVNAYS